MFLKASVLAYAVWTGLHCVSRAHIVWQIVLKNNFADILDKVCV